MPFSTLSDRMASADGLPVINLVARSRDFFGRPAASGLGALTRAVIGEIALWNRRAMDRAELARMSRHELRDIGLNPANTWDEANKPFWRG